MASHSEIAVVNPPDQEEPPKHGKTPLSKSLKEPEDKPASADRKRETQTSSGEAAATLRKAEHAAEADAWTAKDGGTRKGRNARGEPPRVIHMPPPGGVEAANDGAGSEREVTDPELLELLEQLSVTIGTANTVLDAAANMPGAPPPNAGQAPSAGAPETPGLPKEQTAAPQGGAEPQTDDLRPLAERLASRREPPKRKRGGLRLLANAALTGAIFTAGVGWLLYTNPWLLEGRTVPPKPQQVAASAPDAKDQSQLASRKAEPREAAVAAVPALPSLAPPDEDPVPMEMNAAPAPGPAAQPRQPARGSAGQPIPLGLPLPANAADKEVSIMIQGVPEGAELSAGKSLGGGNWLVNETQLPELTLKTDEDFKPGDYQLDVIAVSSDGKVPETRKVTVSVLPAGAMPMVASTAPNAVEPGIAIEMTPAPDAAAPEPAGPALTPGEERTILGRGDTLLREGDVAGARLLLEYAAARGSGKAMVKLAKSYDPDYLAKLGVRGVRPDAVKATQWYARAAKAAAQ